LADEWKASLWVYMGWGIRKKEHNYGAHGEMLYLLFPYILFELPGHLIHFRYFG
jgi:hypothetical protein